MLANSFLNFCVSLSKYVSTLFSFCVCVCLMHLFFACPEHRPEILEDKSQILIMAGKHPVITSLMGDQDQYVPNDTHLQVKTSIEFFRVLVLLHLNGLVDPK